MTETLPQSPLTAKEREILLAASRGFTVEATARLLDISPNTVRTHRRNIIRKFGLKSRDAITGAVAVALRNGYIR